MKKKNIAACLVAVLVLAALSAVYVIASNDNKGILLGQIYKQHNSDKESTESKIIYQSGNISITDEQINYYKSLYAIDGFNISDEEIIKKLVTDTLLYEEALKSGITLSDDEALENMKAVRETIKDDPEGYKTYQSFIESSGLTEDEYWEKALPVYKKAYTIGKYRNYLKDRFREDNPDIEEESLPIAFQEYWGKYKEGLYNKHTHQ